MEQIFHSTKWYSSHLKNVLSDNTQIETPYLYPEQCLPLDFAKETAKQSKVCPKAVYKPDVMDARYSADDLMNSGFMFFTCYVTKLDL